MMLKRTFILFAFAFFGFASLSAQVGNEELNPGRGHGNDGHVLTGGGSQAYTACETVILTGIAGDIMERYAEVTVGSVTVNFRLFPYMCPGADVGDSVNVEYEVRNVNGGLKIRLLSACTCTP